MITTDFVPGSPCWLDVGTPDVAATAAFYTSVFGWDFDPLDQEDGQYGVFRLNGKTVSGIGPLTEAGARPAWMIYFTTVDAEATARTVELLGGAVRAAPFDVDEQGRIGQFTDPLGGQFAVWQPGKSQEPQALDEPGSMSWTELYTTDAGSAKEFYGALFGWQTQDMELPGGSGTYHLVTPAGEGPERMQGGIMQVPGEQLTLTRGLPYWHPVFAVTDCDATVGRVTDGGGSIQMGPEDAEGVGRMAVCLDPFGADFVVLRPAED